METRVSFSSLPASVSQMNEMLEMSLDTPAKTAALSLAVLCNYESNPQETINMLNVLKGPQPLSVYEQQFIRDRLRGKAYLARSYFVGSAPSNDYQPSIPYTVIVEENPYTYAQEGYAVVLVRSSGADSPRQIKLRKKGDKWFLWELQCLSDIRIPVSSDPWA